MNRIAVLTLSLLVVSACKGKVEYRDNPETARELDSCKKSLETKQKYIQELEAQAAAQQLDNGEDDVVVTLTGPLPNGAILEVKGKGPNGRASGEPRGNADDQKLYEAFVASLKRSRGAIKKCYQAALKKDSGLQARTITLDIAVNYRTSGKVRGASFNPRISDAFDRCMEAVANNWQLPAMPRAVSFNYRQTLTPE
jgi:hypothetical protein